MWDDFIINSVIGILKAVVKNPAKKATLKAKLLSVRDAINVAYPPESEAR